MRWAVALGLVVAAATACGGLGESSGPDATPESFIAFASTFQDFRTWTAFHDDGPPPGSVSADVLGPRTQYINKVPQHRTDGFPVGTVIVEARESGARLIFAAVKRGLSFNADGAKNWEWFELAEGADGAVSIVWRGFGPPAGSTQYGGSNRCNICHSDCADNDYVCSPKMLISDF